MSNIKSLDPSTIHRICSGQVIINLANAVKELIENSLDAGAKTIEIRLKNYGSDSIEVIDDGPGILEDDFQTITLKHYTSKIQQYDDLESLETFGFRGEALSSLCALCQMTITTRHSNSTIANRIEYDRNGLIKTKTPCARSVGTTIFMEKIFYTLPVRHKEFLKNLKREFHKLMHVIQCYCLISEGIKLSCYHILGDKTSKLMSTNSRNNLKANIIEIFGLLSMNNMLKFEQVEPDDEILIEYKIKTAPTHKASLDSQESESNSEDKLTDSNKNESKYSKLFQLEGFVSNCAHGQGRSAPDRQYIYVNKRPCDHSKIIKLFNEVFHKYNRTQYPMFVLNINLNSKDVDVNVTPDKLQMFIKNENVLLAIIKSSLIKMYDKEYKNLNLNDSSLADKSSSLMISFFSYNKSKNSKSDTSKLADNLEDEDKLNEVIEMKDEDDEKKKQIKRLRDEDEKQTHRRNEEPNLNRNEKIATKQVDSDDDITLETLVNPKAKQLKLMNEKEETTKILPGDLDENECSKNTAKSVDKHAPVFEMYAPNKKHSPLLNVKSPESLKPSQFTLRDKENLFQTKIGYNKTNTPTSKANEKENKMNETIASLNDESMAERLDLHMCNRESHLLDTPKEITEKASRRRIETDESYDELPKVKLNTTCLSNTNLKENLKALGLTMNETDHDLDKFENLNSSAKPLNSTNNSINPRRKEELDLEESQIFKLPETQPSQEDTITPTLDEHFKKRKEKVLKIDFQSLKAKHDEMIEKNRIEMNDQAAKEKNLLKNLKFKTKNIDSKDAESELDKCITKEDFLKMRVRGQFNKGFIIAQLEQDLFIIDQHAADEIYNFETLQKNGRTDKQRLLQPKYLELPASSEAILIDNLNLLEKLGYEIQICSNRKCGNRIMLTSVPMSSQSNKMLNLRDIDELLFILSESELNPGSISTSSSEQSSNLTDLKSSSLRAMFASKACRMSIMIGDSLNFSQMKRVITHLHEIEKPYNCPHGRPTMRHLINTSILTNKQTN